MIAWFICFGIGLIIGYIWHAINSFIDRCKDDLKTDDNDKDRWSTSQKKTQEEINEENIKILISKLKFITVNDFDRYLALLDEERAAARKKNELIKKEWDPRDLRDPHYNLPPNKITIVLDEDEECYEVDHDNNMWYGDLNKVCFKYKNVSYHIRFNPKTGENPAEMLYKSLQDV